VRPEPARLTERQAKFIAGCVMFGDPEALREKAREFALKAQQAKDHIE
jgi:hypothetical protein